MSQEIQPKVALTVNQLIEIVELLYGGYTQEHIAEMYGASKRDISKINSTKLWSRNYDQFR